MRKIKLLAIFISVTAFSAPAFSIFQLGAQGNYESMTYAQGPDTQKYGGVGVGGFARFTAGIPLLITFAAGPYFDYATLTKSGGTANNGDMKHVRVGAEFAVYLDLIEKFLPVTPYARLGFGYESNTVKTAYLAGGVASATADAWYYGTSGHTLLGVTYKVIPMLYIFAEGGPTWNSLKASIPSELSSVVTASDINSSGWRASIGAMLWL